MIPSVKIFTTLDGVLNFIDRKHLGSLRKKGTYCLKMLRRRDGSRIVFEEMNGVLIDKFETYNSNTVVVHQRSHGKTFQFNETCTTVVAFTSQIFLQNLAMINVYDFSIEFLTVEGIDFACLLKNRSASMSILSDWIDDQKSPLRAKWNQDPEAEEMLKGVGPDVVIEPRIPAARNVDLSESSQQKCKMKTMSYLNRNLDL